MNDPNRRARVVADAALEFAKNARDWDKLVEAVRARVKQALGASAVEIFSSPVRLTEPANARVLRDGLGSDPGRAGGIEVSRDPDSPEFTGDDALLLRELCEHASIALENARELRSRALGMHESFRILSQSLPLQIWTVDSSGVTDFANEEWHTYVGMTTGRAKGRDWLQSVHPDHQERVARAWEAAASSGEPYECEYLLRRFSGEYRWHLSRARAQRDADGKVVKWYGSTLDIHEQKAQNQRLVDALETRDEFLSIASHELKSPLMALRLQVELLTHHFAGTFRSEGEGRVGALLANSGKQVESLISLIEDLMSVSRLREGKLALKIEEMDLVELVHQVVDRLSMLLAAANCRVEVVAPREIRGAWDAHRLDQVIVNLLTNAMKYGAGRPIKITISNERDWVSLSVSDQGVGIAEIHKVRIFGRFERANQDQAISGFGLGLHIAREMVSAHGGRIGVDSELGRGSTFWVQLPASR